MRNYFGDDINWTIRRLNKRNRRRERKQWDREQRWS